MSEFESFLLPCDGFSSELQEIQSALVAMADGLSGCNYVTTLDIMLIRNAWPPLTQLLKTGPDKRGCWDEIKFRPLAFLENWVCGKGDCPGRPGDRYGVPFLTSERADRFLNQISELFSRYFGTAEVRLYHRLIVPDAMRDIVETNLVLSPASSDTSTLLILSYSD